MQNKLSKYHTKNTNFIKISQTKCECFQRVPVKNRNFIQRFVVKTQYWSKDHGKNMILSKNQEKKLISSKYCIKMCEIRQRITNFMKWSEKKGEFHRKIAEKHEFFKRSWDRVSTCYCLRMQILNFNFYLCLILITPSAIAFLYLWLGM